jgi:hypothetical protein
VYVYDTVTLALLVNYNGHPILVLTSSIPMGLI